jgi:endonuclease YncB( thermonuclease family)
MIILITAALSGQVLASEVARPASVIDANTIKIHGQRIRLHGVDPPEKGQPCSYAAGRTEHHCL